MHKLSLYNTLTRNIDQLSPLDGNKVSIYTCGLTVYAQPHIGNWVSYIYWDILVRTLKIAGYNVTRVQNYTDVGHLISDDDDGEDKMEKGARAEGMTAWGIAEKYIAVAEHEAYEILGLLRPDKLIRATSCIPEQIKFVLDLESKGFTYIIPDEGVYFDTSKLTDYGKLARLDIKGLQAGARVDVEGKKNITDFALWKFSPKDKKRDMQWESPWGLGFPGWHLECSVIARESLGDQIDIHTGGIDHIPVHHTNEIAQTEALTGKQFAQIWIHNNHLKVDGRKMSKSLGNIYTLKDITDRGYDIEAFKLFILSKHYTTEGNFTWANLEAAQNRLNELRAWADRRHQTSVPSMTEELDNLWQKTLEDMQNCLSSDLDTVGALNALNVLVTYMNDIQIPNKDGKNTVGALAKIDAMLGLSLDNRPDITDAQKQLLANRRNARDEKKWTESDRIREELKEQGIGINDSAHGQVWFRI